MSLTSVVGIVKDLEIVATEYEDVVFCNGMRNTAGIAATGAALIGEAVSSTILSSATNGAEIPFKVFTCLVGETKVVGKFFRIEFCEGENVEFIGEKLANNFLSVAARSPEQRLIWMLPYHDRGYTAQRRTALKWGLILSSLFAAATLIIDYTLMDIGTDVPIFYRLLASGIVFTVTLIISLYIRSRFSGFAKNATLIFEALGFPHPQKVDLPAISRAATKRLRQENGKSVPMLMPWSYRF